MIWEEKSRKKLKKNLVKGLSIASTQWLLTMLVFRRTRNLKIVIRSSCYFTKLFGDNHRGSWSTRGQAVLLSEVSLSYPCQKKEIDLKVQHVNMAKQLLKIGGTLKKQTDNDSG